MSVRTWKKKLAIGLAVIAVLAGAVALPFALDDQLWYRVSGKNETVQIEGELAKDFELENVATGEFVKLRDLRGKPVALQFFATWCPYCKEQMPSYQALWEDPEVQKMAHVYAVNSRESRRLPYQGRKNVVNRYLRENEYEFPVLLASKQTRKDFRVSPIPALVILDPEGRIVYSGLGDHDEEEMKELLLDAAR